MSRKVTVEYEWHVDEYGHLRLGSTIIITSKGYAYRATTSEARLYAAAGLSTDRTPTRKEVEKASGFKFTKGEWKEVAE